MAWDRPTRFRRTVLTDPPFHFFPLASYFGCTGPIRSIMTAQDSSLDRPRRVSQLLNRQINNLFEFRVPINLLSAPIGLRCHDACDGVGETMVYSSIGISSV